MDYLISARTDLSILPFVSQFVTLCAQLAAARTENSSMTPYEARSAKGSSFHIISSQLFKLALGCAASRIAAETKLRRTFLIRPTKQGADIARDRRRAIITTDSAGTLLIGSIAQRTKMLSTICILIKYTNRTSRRQFRSRMNLNAKNNSNRRRERKRKRKT